MKKKLAGLLVAPVALSLGLFAWANLAGDPPPPETHAEMQPVLLSSDLGLNLTVNLPPLLSLSQGLNIDLNL